MKTLSYHKNTVLSPAVEAEPQKSSRLSSFGIAVSSALVDLVLYLYSLLFTFIYFIALVDVCKISEVPWLMQCKTVEVLCTHTRAKSCQEKYALPVRRNTCDEISEIQTCVGSGQRGQNREQLAGEERQKASVGSYFCLPS